MATLAVILVAAGIGFIAYRPVIDKLDTGETVLWYTPLGDRDSRSYIKL